MTFRTNSVSGVASGTTVRVELDPVMAGEPQIVFATALARAGSGGGGTSAGLRVTVETSAGGWQASNSDARTGPAGGPDLAASASDIFPVNAGAPWVTAKVEALGGSFGAAGADLTLRVAMVGDR